MKKSIIILISLALFYSCDFNPNNKSASTTKSLNVSVENVQINKENKFAWSVKGMVRNNTSKDISGAVNIRFLNERGDIVYTTKTKVNDGGNLRPGQAGVFEYYTEPKNFSGVTNFDVEFYER